MWLHNEKCVCTSVALGHMVMYTVFNFEFVLKMEVPDCQVDTCVTSLLVTLATMALITVTLNI